MKSRFLIVFSFMLVIGACKKSDENKNDPQLIFSFKFDSLQPRLTNIGAASVIPADHGAQSPRFNSMSSHYVELVPSALTALGGGAVLYRNAETSAGGSNAIDFSQSVLAGNNEVFLSIPFKNIIPGSYQYLRVSLAYQNYTVDFRIQTGSGIVADLSGTLASFIGYNTYISTFNVNDSTVNVNANKAQGYWAFETSAEGNPQWAPYLPPVLTGQAPEGATTVPNPIFATSPIPEGSCVVTGSFASPLVITGNETKDIHVTVSLSTNKSFEWVEHSTPGVYEPAEGDTVVDMGIRGLVPIVEN